MRSIKPEDVRIEHLVRSGPGGQHRNRKATCIRLTHLPSGIVVMSANERSQIQNLKRAFEMLNKKLQKKYAQKKKRVSTLPTKNSKKRRVDAKIKHGSIKKMRSKVRLEE